MTRAGVLRDAAITAGVGLWGALQAVAPPSEWRYARSTCATRDEINAPLRTSRALRMAA